MTSWLDGIDEIVAWDMLLARSLLSAEMVVENRSSSLWYRERSADPTPTSKLLVLVAGLVPMISSKSAHLPVIQAASAANGFTSDEVASDTWKLAIWFSSESVHYVSTHP